MTDLFTTEVVAGVLRHMNDDHGPDALRIVQGLGGRPDATVVEAVDLDEEGMVFAVALGNDADPDRVTVGWGQPVRERADIRAAVVAMHDRACAALGVEPGGAHGPASSS